MNISCSIYFSINMINFANRMNTRITNSIHIWIKIRWLNVISIKIIIRCSNIIYFDMKNRISYNLEHFQLTCSILMSTACHVRMSCGILPFLFPGRDLSNKNYTHVPKRYCSVITRTEDKYTIKQPVSSTNFRSQCPPYQFYLNLNFIEVQISDNHAFSPYLDYWFSIDSSTTSLISTWNNFNISVPHWGAFLRDIR